MAAKNVDEASKADHAHCTPAMGHVHDRVPLVEGRVVAFHGVQEHAGVAASDGVDAVAVGYDPGAVPPHAHAGDALPFLRLGDESLAGA